MDPKVRILQSCQPTRTPRRGSDGVGPPGCREEKLGCGKGEKHTPPP